MYNVTEQTLTAVRLLIEAFDEILQDDPKYGVAREKLQQAKEILEADNAPSP